MAVYRVLFSETSMIPLAEFNDVSLVGECAILPLIFFLSLLCSNETSFDFDQNG